MSEVDKGSNSVTKNCTIINEHGLHTRSAASIVDLAQQFECEIILSTLSANADATDMIRLLLLEATKGVNVKICANGKDAQRAVAKLANLIAAGFNE